MLNVYPLEQGGIDMLIRSAYILGMKSSRMAKDHVLIVRTQQDEYQAFQQAARLAGVSVSAWVRERLRQAAIRELGEAGLRAPFLAHLYPAE